MKDSLKLTANIALIAILILSFLTELTFWMLTKNYIDWKKSICQLTKDGKSIIAYYFILFTLLHHIE